MKYLVGDTPEFGLLTEAQRHEVKMRAFVVFKKDKPLMFELPTLLLTLCGVLGGFLGAFLNAAVFLRPPPPDEISIGLCVATALFAACSGGVIGSKIRRNRLVPYLKLAIGDTMNVPGPNCP